MDPATLIPLVLAVAMAIVSLLLHRSLPNNFWGAVFLACLIFMLPVPFLVYGLDPSYLKIASEWGEEADKSNVLLILLAYVLVFTFLMSGFVGLIYRQWAARWRRY